MLSQRQRPIIFAVAAVVLVWLAVWSGYRLAQHSRMTAEKIRAYLRAVDLARLSSEARAKALRELAVRLNALSPEERRAARMDREWSRWFREMTDAEKGAFLEATMPTGFKQMLAAFEE